MPKIKDLGIKFIPETMRPAECAQFTACACTQITNPCLGCTQNLTLQQCVLHTTITICALPTHPCLLHTTITACLLPTHPCLANTTITICPGGSIQCGGTCGGSVDPYRAGELTVEQVKTLREQMQQQISALDEYAKTIGPKTADEIDAREKQLNEELADLKTRRKSLSK